VSRSLLLCILLVLCTACIPGDAPVAGAWSAAGQQGQAAIVAQSFRVAMRLAPDQSHELPLLTSQARPASIENGGSVGQQALAMLLSASPPAAAGVQTAPPGRGRDLEMWEAPQAPSFDSGVLAELQPPELLDLATWLNRGICFEGNWSAPGLRTAMQGLQLTLDALGGDLDLMAAVLGVSMRRGLVYRVCAACFDTGSHFSQPEHHTVTFDSDPDLISFLHETGHVVDFYLARGLRTNATWWSEVGFIGLGWEQQAHQSGEAGAYYLDTDQDAPHSEYSPREDFADTFAAWVLVENGRPLPAGWRSPSYRRVMVLATVPGAMLQ
jgi:hypothetical protein